MLTYCFESAYVPRTLAKCRRNDLAVIDTEGHEKARLKGESKYHEVMSRAAVSTYAEHGAILFSSQCNPIKNGCYIHTPHSHT